MKCSSYLLLFFALRPYSHKKRTGLAVCFHYFRSDMGMFSNDLYRIIESIFLVYRKRSCGLLGNINLGSHVIVISPEEILKSMANILKK